ncbi:MAG TPA: hypothetical protein VN224_10320 [Xanthomonadales bacterium]|nr:hypothetical protein [Xanthomonadales bacterium]
MKQTILHVSMTLALMAMPVAALAADTPAPGASGQMATMACRPATAKDTAASADAMAKAHVMMATMGTEKLVCMKLNHDAMMAESAKAKKMATAAEANAAWVQFLQDAMMVPGGTGGG